MPPPDDDDDGAADDAGDGVADEAAAAGPPPQEDYEVPAAGANAPRTSSSPPVPNANARVRELLATLRSEAVAKGGCVSAASELGPALQQSTANVGRGPTPDVPEPEVSMDTKPRSAAKSVLSAGGRVERSSPSKALGTEEAIARSRGR